jgi:hypothetical protein
MLSKFGGNAAAVDVKIMIKSLQITLEFEAGLNRRFVSIFNESRRQESQSDANSSNPSSALLGNTVNFTGRISTAFEPFMKLYIDSEEK